MAFSQFVVELVEVVVQHALGSEARGDFGNGVLDGLYPLRREAFGVLGIVHRDNLVLRHRLPQLPLFGLLTTTPLLP